MEFIGRDRGGCVADTIHPPTKTYLFYFNFIINSNPHTTQLNPCPHHTPKFNITQLISTKPLSKSKCDFQVFEINFNFISIYRLYH